MATKAMTRQDEAHYVIYRALNEEGWPHDKAYAVATRIVTEMRAVGLTVTKRQLPETADLPTAGNQASPTRARWLTL